MHKHYLIAVVVLLLGSGWGSLDAEAIERLIRIHPSIEINGDGDWTEENGVIAGSGTPDDPYLIRGWTINSVETSAITIRDTRMHARIIENSIIFNYPLVKGGYGVSLFNVENISLSDNRIESSHYSVGVQGGEGVVIDGNVITSLFPHSPVGHRRGISATGVEDLRIKNNHLDNLDQGISVSRSTGFLVESNTITRTTTWGALNIGGSITGELKENSISDCISGIAINVSSFVSVRNNTVKSCNVAIATFGFDSRGGTGESNSFLNNSVIRAEVGISIWKCDACEFQYNIIDRATMGVDLSPRLRFENNTIMNSDTAVSHPTVWNTSIRHNSFIGNRVNAEALNTELDARYNWFGSSDGPAAGSMKGKILYEPWLSNRPE